MKGRARSRSTGILLPAVDAPAILALVEPSQRGVDLHHLAAGALREGGEHVVGERDLRPLLVLRLSVLGLERTQLPLLRLPGLEQHLAALGHLTAQHVELGGTVHGRAR